MHLDFVIPEEAGTSYLISWVPRLRGADESGVERPLSVQE